MLHSAVYLRHVEGTTLGIDENADGRRISEEAERIIARRTRPKLIVSDTPQYSNQQPPGLRT